MYAPVCAAGIGLSLVSATFTAGIFVYIKGIDFEETPMSTFVAWFFIIMGSVALPFTLAMDNWCAIIYGRTCLCSRARFFSRCLELVYAAE